MDLLQDEIRDPKEFEQTVEALQYLSHRKSLKAVLCHSATDHQIRYGLGLSCFLDDHAHAVLRSAPREKLDVTGARLALAGHVLAGTDLAYWTSKGGLHLYSSFALPPAGRQPDVAFAVRQVLAQMFEELHRGYRLRSWMTRVSYTQDLRHFIQAGTELSSKVSEEELRGDRLRWPALTYLDAPSAKAKHSWMSMFFHYTPPRLLLNERSQSMLRLALRGLRDDELARELNVSAETVKKLWRQVFEHVRDIDPQLLPQQSGASEGTRGPEKRSRLLRYLESHPEELTPHEPPRASER